MIGYGDGVGVYEVRPAWKGPGIARYREGPKDVSPSAFSFSTILFQHRPASPLQEGPMMFFRGPWKMKQYSSLYTDKARRGSALRDLITEE